MIKAKALAALALSASVVLGAAPVRARQAAAQDDGDQQVQLGTQEVLLDIVVTDGKGRPVTDLRQDEVKVYEDGKQQAITSFGLVQSDTTTATADAPKPPPSIEISPFRGFNFVIVVVDRTSLTLPDLKATNDAAQKFVAERLGPNDLMAVFVTANRLVMVQNFTNNKQRLSDALRAATDTSGNGGPLDRTNRLGSQVEIAATGSAAGLGSQSTPIGSGAAPGTVTGSPDGTLSNTSNPNSLAETVSQISAISNDVNATYDDLVLQFEGLALVRELLALMKNYSRIPGRKSLLLYSEGLVVDGNVEHTFDSVVGTANRNNFAIYTVDAAGLRGETQSRLEAPSGGSLQSGGGTIIGNRGDATLVDATGNSGIGRAERNVRSGGNSALNRLAVETGGVALRNNNDLNRGFQAVEADLRSYYALAYAPTDADLDGKYRSLKVEVTRKGVDVRTRKGYYATPGSSVLLPFEQPVLAMLADTKPDARPADIPVQMRAERFRSGRGWAVPIVASLPASALAPAPPPDGKDKKDKSAGPAPDQYEVDMIAVVRDSKGSVVAKTSRSFLYQSPKDRADAFKQLELTNMFTQPPVLPPGGYAISLAVYDPNAQKGTVIERKIALPPIAAGAPGLSSLVLSRDVSAVPAAERERAASDPLVFEGTTRIVPNATGRFVKSRGDRIVTYFRFYGAPSKQYQAKLEFVRDGKVVSASSPTAMPTTDAKGETGFAPSIPVDGLEPGSYVVHLVVIDPDTSKPVADSTANFRVDA